MLWVHICILHALGMSSFVAFRNIWRNIGQEMKSLLFIVSITMCPHNFLKTRFEEFLQLFTSLQFIPNRQYNLELAIASAGSRTSKGLVH